MTNHTKIDKSHQFLTKIIQYAIINIFKSQTNVRDV